MAEWLCDQDDKPLMMPRWPISERQILVTLVVDNPNTDEETDPVAYVFQNEQALLSFCSKILSQKAKKSEYLYFTVSKTKLRELVPIGELSNYDQRY